VVRSKVFDFWAWFRHHHAAMANTEIEPMDMDGAQGGQGNDETPGRLETQDNPAASHLGQNERPPRSEITDQSDINLEDVVKEVLSIRETIGISEMRNKNLADMAADKLIRVESRFDEFSTRLSQLENAIERAMSLSGLGNVNMRRGNPSDEDTPVPGITPEDIQKDKVTSALASSLKPVTFGGTNKDPPISTWIESVETWLQCLKCTDEDQKFFLLFNNTSKDAQHTLVHNRKYINEAAPEQRWARIKQLLTSRFGPNPATQAARRQLVREQVQTRHETFEDYANKTRKMNESLDPPLSDLEMQDILTRGIFWRTLRTAISTSPVPAGTPLQEFITDVITRESGLKAAGVLEHDIFSTPPPYQNQRASLHSHQYKRRADTPFPPASQPPASKAQMPMDRIQQRNQYLSANNQDIVAPEIKSFCKYAGYCWWCKREAHVMGGKSVVCPGIKDKTPQGTFNARQQEEYKQWQTARR
jgi:hypothetical protein